MFKNIRPRVTALSASCITHIIQDGFSASLSVLILVVAQIFGLSYAQVGLLKGLRALTQAILEFFSGWIAEKSGDVWLLVVRLCCLAIGFLSLSIATNIVMIAFSFLVIGAGTALHHAPSSSLIVSHNETHQRSGALGIYNAAGDVGKLVFTGTFSLGIGVGFAWNQISFLYGVVAFAAAAAVTILARSLVQTKKPPEQDTPGGNPAIEGWGILNWQAFGALLGVTSIDTAIQTITIIFVPFLMLAKGVPLSLATFAAVILLAGGVLGKAGCGFLAQRIGTLRAFVVVQILTAAGLAVVTFAPNWFALILLFPLGCVLQGSSSITYCYASRLIHPQRMARGFALLYSPGTFASVVGPLLFGWYADFQGIATATYLMALFVLISIPPMLLIRENPQNAE